MSVAEFLSMFDGSECYLSFPEDGYELYISDVKNISSDNLKELLEELWVVGFTATDSDVITVSVNGSITLHL